MKIDILIFILMNKRIEAPKGWIPYLKTFRKMMRKSRKTSTSSY